MKFYHSDPVEIGAQVSWKSMLSPYIWTNKGGVKRWTWWAWHPILLERCAYPWHHSILSFHRCISLCRSILISFAFSLYFVFISISILSVHFFNHLWCHSQDKSSKLWSDPPPTLKRFLKDAPGRCSLRMVTWHFFFWIQWNSGRSFCFFLVGKGFEV